MAERTFGCLPTLLSLPHAESLKASSPAGFATIIAGCNSRIADAFARHKNFWLDTVPADKRTPEQKKLAEQAEVLIKVTWDEIVDALPPADRERRAELRRQANALEARRPAPPAQA